MDDLHWFPVPLGLRVHLRLAERVFQLVGGESLGICIRFNLQPSATVVDGATAQGNHTVPEGATAHFALSKHQHAEGNRPPRLLTLTAGQVWSMRFEMVLPGAKEPPPPPLPTPSAQRTQLHADLRAWFQQRRRARRETQQLQQRTQQRNLKCFLRTRKLKELQRVVAAWKAVLQQERGARRRLFQHVFRLWRAHRKAEEHLTRSKKRRSKKKKSSSPSTEAPPPAYDAEASSTPPPPPYEVGENKHLIKFLCATRRLAARLVFLYGRSLKEIETDHPRALVHPAVQNMAGVVTGIVATVFNLTVPLCNADVVADGLLRLRNSYVAAMVADLPLVHATDHVNAVTVFLPTLLARVVRLYLTFLASYYHSFADPAVPSDLLEIAYVQQNRGTLKMDLTYEADTELRRMLGVLDSHGGDGLIEPKTLWTGVVQAARRRDLKDPSAVDDHVELFSATLTQIYCDNGAIPDESFHFSVLPSPPHPNLNTWHLVETAHDLRFQRRRDMLQSFVNLRQRLSRRSVRS
jgi:hypothetical protein